MMNAGRLGISRVEFARLLLCRPLYVMLTLLVIEAALGATTTWLIIQAGRDVASNDLRVMDFVWILVVQSTSYIVGAISWVFAEQAGFGAHGRYMLAFARANRGRATLFADKNKRESVEPFLTNETFHIFFELMYELEHALKLALGLVFNAIVLGLEIDGSLPIAYFVTFLICIALQLWLKKPVSEAYLNNQKATNRMTAHSYTAWDNIFVGNRSNYRLWHAGFKERLRNALRAQIRAIVAREGLSTASGIISLIIVFLAVIYAGMESRGDTATLIALAATLPKQIDLANDVHGLASAWNDLVAIWTRIGGATEHFLPEADPEFNERIKFEQLVFSDDGAQLPVANFDAALALATTQPLGRINLRGSNGAGKSTVLAALKSALGPNAYYWPTTDRLSYKFADGVSPEAEAELEDDDAQEEEKPSQQTRPGFSSGERQIQSLQEIVATTAAPIYLLDEWDANLDGQNRAIAQALIDTLAKRARVIEISHRDRAVVNVDADG
jgi:ABC-type bacteriocin/lantibiotic exporter with double-glycine peptidase domain